MKMVQYNTKERQTSHLHTCFSIISIYTPCTKYWPMPSGKWSRLYNTKTCFNYNV